MKNLTVKNVFFIIILLLMILVDLWLTNLALANWWAASESIINKEIYEQRGNIAALLALVGYLIVIFLLVYYIRKFVKR